VSALWVEEAAEQFWAAVGEEPAGFPRDLRRAIALALPLAVVELPRLRVAAIEEWLAQRRRPLSLATRDRRVRACLLVYQGTGVVFLDGTDPADEQRFSLAHEVAHFLLHYVQPREQAVQRLGSAILAVFDGDRRPALGERVEAVLAGIGPLQPHLHLLDRPDRGPAHFGRLGAVEEQADTLALELLAPSATVRTRLDACATVTEVQRALSETFGLPASVAATLALELQPEPDQSLLQRLGLA
jgi:hypothetical protein